MPTSDPIENLLYECMDHLRFIEQDVEDGDLSVAAENARRAMQLAEDLMEHIKIRMQVEATR